MSPVLIAPLDVAGLSELHAPSVTAAPAAPAPASTARRVAPVSSLVKPISSPDPKPADERTHDSVPGSVQRRAETARFTADFEPARAVVVGRRAVPLLATSARDVASRPPAAAPVSPSTGRRNC